MLCSKRKLERPEAPSRQGADATAARKTTLAAESSSACSTAGEPFTSTYFKCRSALQSIPSNLLSPRAGFRMIAFVSESSPLSIFLQLLRPRAKQPQI